MISVTSFSYSASGRELFRHAAFTIKSGTHCTLIGSNGTGKTTLIDLLLHPEEYLFQGRVNMDDVHNVGYVNQFVEHQKERPLTVSEYLAEDFEKLQSQMDSLCVLLETAENSDEIMIRYQNALDTFISLDGYNYEINIQRRLRTAGLEQIGELTLSEISGGEYKLVQIIRQMLRLPDLLVMDEPDVFLDFDNLKGLKELINTYTGTLLVATHNRYLLNHCFNHILLIENRQVQEYEGTYTEFCFMQLQMKIALQELSRKETEFIAFEEQVVERMRDDASKYPDLKKGKTLHARVSYLERWKVRHVEEPYIETREPIIRFPDTAEEVGCILTVDHYGIAFDEKLPLLKEVSFTVQAGEKVALVGANGTGKTTLLRTIWKNNSPSVSLSPVARIDFLSQFHGETLMEDQTAGELMASLGFVNDRSAAEYLCNFCFEEELLYHPIRTLSGGEKNMLQLARLCLGNGNLLLLDEPTSHLDLYAQKALQKAITEYRGAVIMVSHDFYTVSDCMDYVLLAENGTIRKMSGRAFRKMVYKRHFSQNYLELEQKKKELEEKINAALRSSDYEAAKQLCVRLEEIIEIMEA